MDIRTRAQLVAPDAFPAGAIGTVIPRAEIEAAAQGDFPATFLLEVDRVEAPDDVTAHATIALDWDEKTLGQLLASTDASEIELLFDGRGLESAFDDVEAHGLREKAAVLAVAAAAAGLSAGPAMATVAPADGGSGGSAASVATPQGLPMGVQRGLQQDQQIGVARQVHGFNTETPAVSTGGSGVSTGEIAGIAGAAGVLLVTAAGFGVARKRTPPAQPA